MNIRYVTKEYPPETGWGGIGSYSRDMALLLVARGHTVVVISQGDTADTYANDQGVHVYRVAPRLAVDKIPFFWRLNRVWSGHRLAVCRKFVQLSGMYHFNILETPDIHGEAVLILMLRKLRILRGFTPVIRLHTAVKITVSFYEIRNIQYYKSVLAETLSFMLCRHYSAPGKLVAETEKRLYPALRKRNVRIISNPLFLTKECEPQGRRKVILFVGRLEYWKGFDLYCRLMKALGEAYEYVAIGNVSDFARQKIERLPERLRSHLTLPGHCSREELLKYYSTSLIGVCPTRWESFGYVIAEMMWCGLPAVISDGTGLASVTISGEHNIQFRNGDVDDLISKTRILLGDYGLKEKLSVEGKQFIRVESNPDQIAEEMIDFYREAAGQA